MEYCKKYCNSTVLQYWLGKSIALLVLRYFFRQVLLLLLQYFASIVHNLGDNRKISTNMVFLIRSVPSTFSTQTKSVAYCAAATCIWKSSL